MANRLSLQAEFEDVLGSPNVYFQPPSSMNYPCIKYSIGRINVTKADDRNYRNCTMYDVVVIDPDPDSEIPSKLLEHFPMCSFDRSYVANNLNHFALSLYY